ncbi:MAG: prolipoprotein diacylglyceryl transferase [Acholeplasmataceae bacterium]
MNSNFFNKYRNLILYGGLLLVFLILVLIATRGTAPYDKIAIRIGDFEVAWYAVFILTGIIFGTLISYSEFVNAGLDPDILWDGLLIFVPLSIVGARLWYVLFNLDSYQGNFLRMLDITEGGLGIHGAVIVTFLGIILFAKIKKVNYFFILDVVAPGFLIGQTLGRWGNFMNQELYGPVVDNLNWLPNFISKQMLINNEFRHPTFLYESIWNLIGLILMLFLRNKKNFKLGDLLALYLVWYGIGRIPTESLRLLSGVDEPLMAFGIPVSIATSVLLIVAGLLVFILKRIYFKDLGSYKDYGKKIVLFDLDGTLLDTKDDIYNNLRKTFKRFYPGKIFSDEDLKPFFGPTLNQSFSNLEKDPKKVNKMIDYYKEVAHGDDRAISKTFPHAYETLKTLKENGFLIGVVSSKIKLMVEKGLRDNDLLDFVDIIVGSDNVNNHKPHPEPIHHALSLLKIDSHFAYYVGDHPNDVLSAKEANVTFIGVSYSISYHELLKEKPDYIIDSLDKLLYIV